MYSLFKNLGAREFVISELPALGISLVISELAFRFGSFTLEAFAFLATWWFVSFLINKTKHNQ